MLLAMFYVDGTSDHECQIMNALVAVLHAQVRLHVNHIHRALYCPIETSVDYWRQYASKAGAIWGELSHLGNPGPPHSAYMCP